MKTRFRYTLLMILTSLSVLSQKTTVLEGKITDDFSQSIPKVSVHVLNTNYGTTTDATGQFRIINIPPGRYTLQISAIGYATIDKNIILSGSGHEPMVINLKPSSTQLDAVIVSAQKKEESLQKIPFSISSISSAQVQEYRLWDIKEITAIVPNLYASDPGDNRNVSSIRGITTTSYDPAIATYIDGVNQFNLDTYIAQLVDVERIEILRGPQGTLYGRNAMGGVINIITKQPSNQWRGNAELSIGNYGQHRFGYGIRFPLVKDKLFAGFAGVYEGRKGFYTNQFNNTSFDRQKGATGNYFLKFIPGPKWNFTLNAKHYWSRNHGTFPLAINPDSALKYAFQLNQDAVTKMIDDIFNASFSINHFGKSFHFSSQTAYQSNHRYYDKPIDGDFSPIDGISIINNYGKDWNRVKVFTQEFKLSSPASSGSPLNWTAGSYVFVQDNPVKQAVRFGNDADLVGAPDKNFSVISTAKGKNYGIAFFGQVTYSITDKVDLIAGLRYDYEKKKLSVLGEYQKDPDPLPAFQTQPDTSAGNSFSAFSPKLGLAYRITDNSNMYITYSRGYRTGGLTQLSSDPSVPPLYPYQPEYSDNIEIGIKNNLLSNRLYLNIAAFYTRVKDAQVPTLIVPDAITITRNAGKLTSKGIEMELAATPVKGLQAVYNVGFTDAEYKTLKLSQNGSSVDLAGKKQLFTPDMTSMLALQYSHELGTRQKLKLVVRGEWIYLGKQYFDLSNNISQSPYHLLNTRFGVSAKNVEIMFWGRNLADKNYISYAYDFGAVHLGNPKTYGVTLLGKF
ncbi:MAG: TonB-dependent receptor [Chitinophagaceae bacterium]|nr:TonB-dependent receptor [Chitinophagaceae bacterium]